MFKSTVQRVLWNSYQRYLCMSCHSPQDAIRHHHLICLKRFKDTILHFTPFEKQEAISLCVAFIDLTSEDVQLVQRFDCINYLLDELHMVIDENCLRRIIYLWGVFDGQDENEVVDYLLKHFNFSNIDKAALGAELLAENLRQSRTLTTRTGILLKSLHKHGMLNLEILRANLGHFTMPELRLIIDTFGYYLRPYDQPREFRAGTIGSTNELEWFIQYFHLRDFAAFPFERWLVSTGRDETLFINFPGIRQLVMSVSHRTLPCPCKNWCVVRCPFYKCFDEYEKYTGAVTKSLDEAGLHPDVVRYILKQYL